MQQFWKQDSNENAAAPHAKLVPVAEWQKMYFLIWSFQIVHYPFAK